MVVALDPLVYGPLAAGVLRFGASDVGSSMPTTADVGSCQFLEDVWARYLHISIFIISLFPADVE
jgi:hypothetical protein